MENNNATNNLIKIILAIALAFSFVVNSIMFSWEATRRPQDMRTAEQKRYESCITFTEIEQVQDCEKIKDLAK